MTPKIHSANSKNHIPILWNSNAIHTSSRGSDPQKSVSRLFIGLVSSIKCWNWQNKFLKNSWNWLEKLTREIDSWKNSISQKFWCIKNFSSSILSISASNYYIYIAFRWFFKQNKKINVKLLHLPTPSAHPLICTITISMKFLKTWNSMEQIWP